MGGARFGPLLVWRRGGVTTRLGTARHTVGSLISGLADLFFLTKTFFGSINSMCDVTALKRHSFALKTFIYIYIYTYAKGVMGIRESESKTPLQGLIKKDFSINVAKYCFAVST